MFCATLTKASFRQKQTSETVSEKSNWRNGRRLAHCLLGAALSVGALSVGALSVFGPSFVQAAEPTMESADSPIWKTRTPSEWASVLDLPAPETSTSMNDGDSAPEKAKKTSKKTQKSQKSSKKTKSKQKSKSESDVNPEVSSSALPAVREQWYAAYALGQYGSEAASTVPILLRRLEMDFGKDDDVRACILYSLGLIGDSSAFPAILKEYDSKYPILQRTAVLALSRFPERLAEETETLEKMEAVLTARSESQFPLAANCAAALWAVGRQETVLTWISASIASERKESFTQSAEIYMALSALHQILTPNADLSTESSTESSTETSEETSEELNKNQKCAIPEADAEKLATQLTALISSSEDTDVVLSACEVLAKLRDAAIPPLRAALAEQLNARLLRVLAKVDSQTVATQELLFSTLSDDAQPENIRISAIRGMEFLPEEQRETAAAALVTLLNAQDTPAVLAEEARFVLKKLQ